jgi:hypothetical protein
MANSSIDVPPSSWVVQRAMKISSFSPWVRHLESTTGSIKKRNPPVYRELAAWRFNNTN